MRKLYLSFDDDPQKHYPNVHLLNDARLFAALHRLYLLLEAEYDGKYYLIFDYRPSLPKSPDEVAMLPKDVLDTTITVLEFDNETGRRGEIERIRQSLWGEDDGNANASRLRPMPPLVPAGNTRDITDERYPRRDDY